MHAAIVSIGDELTLGQALNTNSAWLSAQLAERSIITREHRTVSDDRGQIAQAIRELACEHELLIITGGLGPTADDLTREAVADVLTPGRPLVVDDQALGNLHQWFEERGRRMPEMNVRQALRPASMRCVSNPNGTAPGLMGMIANERGECRVFCLPGPPREMQPMFLNHVAPELPAAVDGQVLLTAIVQEFGMGESHAALKIAMLMKRDRNPLVGTTASQSIVSARIRAVGPHAEAERHLEDTLQAVERLWWPYAFGRGETILAESIGGLLKRSGKWLATAESCTGGALGSAIVEIAGSSAYYRGGWVTYSNAVKHEQLGVPLALLEEHGAVSEPIASAMARNAADLARADYALAITGIAGPEGGSPAKPVGTVYIALGIRNRSTIQTQVRRFQFPGERSVVRDRAVKAALQMLRFSLLNVPDSTPLIWQAGQHLPRVASGETLPEETPV